MQAPTLRSRLALITILSLAACASDLREESDAGATGDVDASTAPKVETDPAGDGFETRINSSDFDVWIYISFEAGATEAVAASDGSLDWDVAFKRFQIKLNGGVSGAGVGELAIESGATLADITVAPTEGYVTDAPDSPEDEDEDAELAFETAGEGWYDYDPESHVLTPKERVYVVRGAAVGTLVALEIKSYYNDAGSSGRFTIHWKAL